MQDIVKYKKKSFLYLFIFCFSCLNLTLYAQKRELRFEYYTTADGLSHNTVHCFIQDKKGFLWIGTEDGLNMFDGYTFTSFKKNTADPLSIADNFINCLFLDNDDNLWIGTNNKGVCKYDKYTGLFESFSNYELDGQTLPFKMVYSIVGDSKGHLWFGTFGGLFEFDPGTEQIIAQYHYDGSENGLSGEEIRYLYMEANDILWVGTDDGGLNRFDINSRTFTQYKHDANDKTSISNNSVSSVLRDYTGILWVGTSWGLNSLDEESGKFRRFYNDSKNQASISDNVIFSIYEDHLDNLWIGTLSGLNQYDRKNDNFLVWKYTPSLNPTILDNYIFTIFEDRFNQIWLGTATKGVGKFNNQQKSFKHYYINPAGPSIISNNTVREIYEDDNKLIWLGILNGGLFLFNPDNQQYRSFRHNPAVNTSLSDNRVNTVFKDSKKNVWIGTWDGGLNRAIPENGRYRFEHYFHNPADPSSVADNVIQEIAEDRWGQIWLGTGSGLDLFDPVTNKAIHFKHSDSNPNSLVANDIQSGGLVFDRNGNLWVGTFGGLSKVVFSPTTHLPEKFLNYKQNDTSEFSLSDNRIIALNLDSNNILWAGTFGGGLNKISLNEKGDIIDIKSYTEQDGLSNNVVYTILTDDQGLLWLSTNNGLSRFNRETGKFDNYDLNDGLQSNQFYWGAACKLRSGELSFGGINGFNLFDPADIFPDTIAPEIVITDLRINGNVPGLSKDATLKNVVYADTIGLTYVDKTISFEFSALHFADPASNQYKYRLEGFNEEWITTTAKKRYAVFTNLDPGEYKLMVKGSNADGFWNEKGLSLTIIMTPPFWKTWWFLTGLVLLFIVALFLIYWYRVAALRRQKNQLEKAVQEKTAEILHKNTVLQAVNEEFSAANQKLEFQRQELERILHSLKDAQTQLIQSEKMASLGILAAGVAHEINNPLNFINWGVEALQDYLNENVSDDETAVAPLIDGIKDGVKRAADIVASLSLYSRKDDLPASKVDVHTVIESCLIMLNSQLKERIEVQKKFLGEPLYVLCNQGRLHQVFLNILTNAIHSISDQGVITIFTTVKKGSCLVSITDNGCGIRSDMIPKITDPFFTTKEPGKGTGLGLSISYNILQDYGGTIGFESEEQIGTTVHVTLPLILKTDL